MRSEGSDRYSAFAALQFYAAGGNWWIRDALDVSSQQHAYLYLTAVTRTIKVFVESGEDVLYRFDNSSADTIEAANGAILEKNKEHVILVPLRIDLRPYIHFKQVASHATGKIRIVER